MSSPYMRTETCVQAADAARTRRWAKVWSRALVGALLGLAAAAATAQTFESVLSPGKLIEGHAKLEDNCRECHVPFDRAAQDVLCMDCHKDVGADVRGKAGYHGRIKAPRPCRACHTDHRGREMRIAEFDTKTFDHALTDYVLRGKHAKVDCKKCHEPGKRWREAPLDCNACHRNDDVHKGSLGPKCTDCHTENDWKETRFDHDKTRFKLTGKHADAKCADCHTDPATKAPRYKDTPRTCIGCHKADDKHKGQFGEKCETCHGTRDWKTSTFNHDTDTKYPLRGKHRDAKCESCHKGHLYKEKLSTACVDCHKKDDKHKGTLGNECANCHTERDWKEPSKFDHDKTKFPLLGKHAKVECKDCHKSTLFKEAPSTCIGCHKKDDKHEGTLGEKCADCHTERDWKASRFDHDKTKFALRGGHAAPKVKCTDCHKDQKSYRNTPTDCYACHKKDDKHEGQQGKQCDQCHTDRDWKTTRFDHGRTRFPLTGRHITVECKKCHETRRFKDARRECYACHKKEDKHKLKFGERCEKCHSTRDWKLWDFDHDKRTDYKLEGAHRKVACESCHTRPAPAGKDAAALGRTCFTCHRGDDVHDGAFGIRCEQCHVATNWKQITNRLSGASDPIPIIGGPRRPPGVASHMARVDQRRPPQ
jgi:hypothetical protein